MFFFFTDSPSPYCGPNTNSSLVLFPCNGQSMLESLQSIKSNQNDKMLIDRFSRSTLKSHFHGQKRQGKSRVIPFSSIERMSDFVSFCKFTVTYHPFILCISSGMCFFTSQIKLLNISRQLRGLRLVKTCSDW